MSTNPFQSLIDHEHKVSIMTPGEMARIHGKHYFVTYEKERPGDIEYRHFTDTQLTVIAVPEEIAEEASANGKWAVCWENMLEIPAPYKYSEGETVI